MIFIAIFCGALNGKYSALYRERKGGRVRREYQACVCVCVCVSVRMWGSLGPGHLQWYVGYAPLGSGGMSYYNQTPFPLRKGGVWARD